MGICLGCKSKGPLISGNIGFCADCIRKDFSRFWPQIKKKHEKSRQTFNLPVQAPHTPGGIICGLCIHECRMVEGEVGFCGQRKVQQGRILGGRPHEGNLSFMRDPLPTNCVASFACPGGTGRGYPKYAYRQGPEHGQNNLAVFYQACGFNCLYCQNHHFKLHTGLPGRVNSKQLAGAVDNNTSCICYFGGDPTPQILHALKTSALARKQAKGKIMRICWETNGSMNPKFLDWIYALSLDSGGCIKFDLKAWSETIHYALCGVSNRRTLNNFRVLAGWQKERKEPALLFASTLLVPGYVDQEEVGQLARFIASLDPEIPYSLLAFYPSFQLKDLPVTSRVQAELCRDAALKAGLKHVHLGNEHLLV